MIRDIKVSDIDGLMDLIEESLYLDNDEAVPSESYMLEAITLAMKSNPVFYLRVAEVDGKLVSFMAAQVTQSFMQSSKQANVITAYAESDYEDTLKDLFKDVCEWAYSAAAYDVYALSEDSSKGLSRAALDDLGAKPVSTEYSYKIDKER